MKYLFYLTLLLVDVLGDNCHLCSGFIQNSTSCQHIAAVASSVHSQSPLCDNIKLRFDKCCKPPFKPQPKSFRYVGPHKVCDICNGGYPGNEAMVIHFLYLGAGTCVQYYKFGMEGRIPSHLCSPVQFYSEKVCDCI